MQTKSKLFTRMNVFFFFYLNDSLLRYVLQVPFSHAEREAHRPGEKDRVHRSPGERTNTRAFLPRPSRSSGRKLV